jgi:hypothetical protein
MHGLSKSRVLAHLQCPRRLWLQVHRPELVEYDSGTKARFAAGARVGEVARGFYPDGTLIDAPDLAQALDDTARLLDGPPGPLFEATLQADGVLVQADLLWPDGNGRWGLTEVKSSTSVKDYHYLDAAVQARIARAAGIKLSRVEIAHVDNRFVYPGDGDYDGLLTRADVTDAIAPLEAEVPAWISAARATLDGDDPETPPGDHCHDPYDCPFLGHCVPFDPLVFPPEILPRHRGLAATLRTEGHDDLRTVPAARLTNPLHRRVLEVTQSGRAFLDPAAGLLIEELLRPHYYLDFETIQFAVPVWAGTRPYQQIPFQWSCHIEDESGEITHREFLAEPPADPRRAFATTMLEVLGDRGPVFVYHAAFERSRINELADAFPDLAPALHSIAARIVDLLPIVREHYYHRDMRGSWSIKAVLPTIAPELAYEGLEIGDGAMAAEAFRELLQSEMMAERRRELRDGLLKYCERDTWAMVRIARFLRG